MQDAFSFPQQPQQQHSIQDLYANTFQEERLRNILSQISPDNQLHEVEMRLRGYKKDIFTGTWEKIGNFVVSETLVERYIGFLSAFMNQSTALSNLTEKNINNIMGMVIEYLSDDLDAHSEEYGIGNNYTERTRVGNIIVSSTFFVLNRALNGQEARRMWSSLSLRELSGGTGKQQSVNKGMLEGLKFWK